MSKKSPAISKELARINPQAEPILEVLEPGPNPPTPEAIKRLMLKKITTNAERMINSLILLASNGHFQSAHYLLEEMTTLGVEMKNESGRSINEILARVARHLAIECNIECPEEEDASGNPAASANPDPQTNPAATTHAHAPTDAAAATHASATTHAPATTNADEAYPAASVQSSPEPATPEPAMPQPATPWPATPTL